MESGFNFNHQMAGYRVTIEIGAFQLANNGLAICYKYRRMHIFSTSKQSLWIWALG